MDYGTLRIATPDGQVREHVIDSPSVYVGRADTNRVVIDHVSVSRRHARLTIESGRLMVEDLGSSSGTFVGGQRLSPNRPALADGGLPIRFGEAEAVFTPMGATAPAAPQAPMAAAAPMAAMGATVAAAAAPSPSPSTHQAVGVTLKPPAGPVEAGASTTAAVAIQNRGTIVDELSISVGGIPPGWVRIPRAQVSLLPGGRDEVTVVIEPPRSTEVRAGEHEFWVAVTSRQHGAEVRALGTVTVLPFGGMEARLEPVRAERNFRLVLENRGNAMLDLRLGATDDEEAIEFTLGAPAVQVPPGESRTVALQARLKARKMFGPPEVHAFRVEAVPVSQAPGAQKAVVNGQLVRKPPLQAWKRPALALLLVAALIGGGFGYTRVCGSSWPFCPGGDGGIPAGNGGGAGGGGGSTPGTGGSPSPGGQQGGSVGSPAASPSPGTSPSPKTSPGSSPAASPSPSPGSSPSVKPPSGPPKINWVVADHAGTGAVQLRISTDIPTVAKVSVYRPTMLQRGTPVPTPPPGTSDKPDTLHTISMPTYSFPAGFAIEVTSEDGQAAFASLEYSESISGYWAASQKEPVLSFASGLKASVTWTAQATNDLKLDTMEVLLFSKKAGCRTADLCLGELIGSFQASSKAASDGKQPFAATVTFPDNKHDYQVVLTSRAYWTAGDRKGMSLAQFYEIEVVGTQLK